MKEMQETRYRASMTVETAYLMPLFFLMFILIMRIFVVDMIVELIIRIL